MSDEASADIEDDPRVITIGDLRIKRLTRRQADIRLECDHHATTMDPEGEIITCNDCGKQLSAYWLLERFVTQFQAAHAKVKAEFEMARWERSKTVRMVAAKRIEDTWRRGMVPTCPFCSRGIRPEDGLGNTTIAKFLDARQREGVTT